jgi:ATP-dependent DNA helicase RecG
VEQRKRAQVIERIRAVLMSGQQAYWVCTLIEDSDEIEATSATSLYDQLRAALPDFRLALLHGRMKSDEKVATMQSFKRGEVQLLVATTVVEVGVDVANATHMVIENAERLGLAQLHQLRGRVGRGDQPSHCYLMFTPGLSEAAKTRLNALRESQDGFYLAEQDLALRGPGDILGTRQSGEQTFRVADLGAHAHLMGEVMRRGDTLMRAVPDSTDADTMQQLLRIWAPAESGSMSV